MRVTSRRRQHDELFIPNSMLTKPFLFGWIGAVLLLFAFLPKRIAVIVGFVAGWLFLPVASIPIPGLPDYSKLSAIVIAVVLGTLVFDLDRVLRFRPSWLDLPIVAFCLAASVPSLTMGLGVWDAISAMIQQVLTWLIAYLIGRLYFCDQRSFRELAIGIIIGGLVYVPLCLIEIRISPQLHHSLYGYYPRGVFGTLGQARRFGGWRPTVFMEHGLAVGIWMSNAALIAIWLWVSQTIRRLYGIRMAAIAFVLLVAAVLCKSTGAVFLMLIGMAALMAARCSRRIWPVGFLLLIPPIWMGLRTLGLFDGKLVLDLFHGVLPERAQSFAFRLDQEDTITLQVMQHPFFGGGRWFDDGADQLWLLTFRNYGLFGLTSFTLFFLMPPAMVLLRMRSRLLQPQNAPILCLAVVVCLHMIDHLVNGMINPVFTLATGALASAAVHLPYRSTVRVIQLRARRERPIEFESVRPGIVMMRESQ